MPTYESYEPIPDLDAKAPEGHEWFAIGANVWGKGPTPREARRNCPGAWNQRLVFSLAPAGAYVDWYGSVAWQDHDADACPACDLTWYRNRVR